MEWKCHIRQIHKYTKHDCYSNKKYKNTHITPPPHNIQQVKTSKWQVHNTFIDSFAASLWRKILLSNLHPP